MSKDFKYFLSRRPMPCHFPALTLVLQGWAREAHLSHSWLLLAVFDPHLGNMQRDLWVTLCCSVSPVVPKSAEGSWGYRIKLHSVVSLLLPWTVLRPPSLLTCSPCLKRLVFCDSKKPIGPSLGRKCRRMRLLSTLKHKFHMFFM